MDIVIALFVTNAVAFGCGYAFRGFIGREIAKAKAELVAEFNKIKAKL